MDCMERIFAKEWKKRFNQCGKQKTAADALGVGESAASLWGPKTGTIPGVEDHEKIAHAYGLSPAWLAWGHGPSDRNAYEWGMALGDALQGVPAEEREKFIDGVATLASLTYAPPTPASLSYKSPPTPLTDEELSALLVYLSNLQVEGMLEKPVLRASVSLTRHLLEVADARKLSLPPGITEKAKDTGDAGAQAAEAASVLPAHQPKSPRRQKP